MREELFADAASAMGVIGDHVFNQAVGLALSGEIGDDREVTGADKCFRDHVTVIAQVGVAFDPLPDTFERGRQRGVIVGIELLVEPIERIEIAATDGTDHGVEADRSWDEIQFCEPSGWGLASTPCAAHHARFMQSRWWDPRFPFDPARSPFFYGWTILGVATLTILMSVPGQTIGVGVFTDVFEERLGLERVQLSLAYLIGTTCSGFLLPLGGAFIDRWGTRRATTFTCLIFGVILLGIAQIDRIAAGLHGWLPFVPGWLIAFIAVTVGFFLIRFLGQGMLTVCGRTTLAKWFDRRRGLVLGLSGVAISLVFSAAPKGLDAMIQSVGWRGAYQVLAGVSIVVVAALGWWLIRDNPEECGLRMDGDEQGEVVPAAGHQSDRHFVRDLTRGEALRTFSFWAFNLATAWQALLVTALTFHITSIAEEAGIGRDEALGLFIPIAILSVISNLFSGWLADRTRAKYILVILSLSMVVAAIGLVYLNTTAGRWMLVVGVGVAGGTFQTTTGLVWPRFYGRRYVGAISGFNMSTIVIASALGPFLFSVANEWFGSYRSAYATSVFIPLLFLAAAWWADNPQRKL